MSFLFILHLKKPYMCLTHPAILWVMGEPAYHSLQDVFLVSHIQLLHSQHLTEALGWQLPELLCNCHIPEVCLEILSGDVVDMVKTVVQGEELDANAVLCSDATLKELTAEGLQVSQEQQVRRLYHVLDGLFAQMYLYAKDKRLCVCVYHNSDVQMGSDIT